MLTNNTVHCRDCFSSLKDFEADGKFAHLGQILKYLQTCVPYGFMLAIII